MWMEETRGTRINAERTRQALETGAGTVATSCPFCMVMMKDGLADAAASAGSAAGPGSAAGAAPGVVSARDIAEILADVIEPDPIPVGRRLPVLQ
jgi:Fe-S oxidoreductase